MEIKYILIHKYHDTNIDTFDNLSLLKLALSNLKENFKNDSDFSYVIYCGKDVTDLIDELDSIHN